MQHTWIMLLNSYLLLMRSISQKLFWLFGDIRNDLGIYETIEKREGLCDLFPEVLQTQVSKLV